MLEGKMRIMLEDKMGRSTGVSDPHRSNLINDMTCAIKSKL
jgi:hypothetical protein